MLGVESLDGCLLAEFFIGRNKKLAVCRVNNEMKWALAGKCRLPLFMTVHCETVKIITNLCLVALIIFACEMKAKAQENFFIVSSFLQMANVMCLFSQIKFSKY